jgi:DNA (cytosine-5)-methyltransferase 1
MKVASLFAGIGGFDLALERKGHTVVYANEWDRYAAYIYDRHFTTKIDRRDITRVDATLLPDFDLLVGGFPCQAFSIAGKREGFDDIRGTLFFDVARVLRQKRPRLVLLENVKGLLSHGGGKTFHVILNTLDELGYNVQWQVLDSKDFGIPQHRERVFIVGHTRGSTRPQVFPLGGDAVYRPGSVALIDRSYPSRIREYRSVAPTIRDYGSGGNKMPLVDGQRRMTPLEFERLQGFPDSWTEGISDTQRYKCLGNAVTVNVVGAIVSRFPRY